MTGVQGSVRQMEWLTGDQIRSRRFARAQLGWRGYTEDEVEGFLAEVAEQVSQYERQFSALYAEVRRLRDFFREAEADVDLRRSQDRVDVHGSLVPWLERYAEVMVGLAQDCATLAAAGEDRSAENRLDHACVRTSMAIRQQLTTQVLTSDAGVRWIVEFARALTAQAGVVSEELSSSLSR
jgi:DivIVA domain-containing protein